MPVVTLCLHLLVQIIAQFLRLSLHLVFYTFKDVENDIKERVKAARMDSTSAKDAKPGGEDAAKLRVMNAILEAKLQKMEKEFASLRTIIDGMIAQQKSLATDTKTADNLKKKNETLTRDMASVRTEKDKVLLENNTLRAQKATLTTQYNALFDDFEKLLKVKEMFERDGSGKSRRIPGLASFDMMKALTFSRNTKTGKHFRQVDGSSSQATGVAL